METTARMVDLAEPQVCPGTSESSMKGESHANKSPTDDVMLEVVPSEEATMTIGHAPSGLQLTEDEAFALLGLCMTSPQKLDALSEKALRKLASFCKSRNLDSSNHIIPAQCEQSEAG
jgi:hypothetical protein